MKIYPILGVLASCLALAMAQAQPVTLPQRAALLSSPDEEYFLVRTLDTLYGNWPQNSTKPDEFIADAAELRRQALRLRVRAERAGFAAEITKGYTDFISLLDAYTTFLQNLGVIRKSARDRADKENFQSGLKGGMVGGETLATLSQNENVSGGEALVGSLLAGGIAYAMDSWGKAEKRDEAERDAVNAEARKIQDQFTATLEDTRQGFLKLAAVKGWTQSEVGWGTSAARAEAIQKLVNAGDLAGLIRECSRQCKERPRDPHPKQLTILFEALQNEDNPEVLARLAEDSHQTQAMIPADPVYSDYRLAGAYQAACIARAARTAERAGGGRLASTAISRRSVALHDEVLRLDPADSTGEYRFLHAVARLEDGDPRSALAEADQVIRLVQADPAYLYDHARILSQAGELDRSLQVLDAALKAGYDDIAAVRADPDLAPLARERAQKFQDLVTPDWAWDVTDDLLWDDVILKNNSPYALTNVVFSVELKQEGRNVPLELKCASIQPGAEQKWIDVVQGADGHWDKSSTAKLSCDQTKE